MGAKARLICEYSSCPLLSIILSGLFLSTIGCGNGGGGGGTAPPPSVSTVNKLSVEILEATISSNPVVTFRLTDDQGNPVDRNTVTLGFIIARIEKGDEEYTDYITLLQQSAVQADFEGSGANPLGIFEDMPNGVSKYTFNKALPENFDRNVTHTVGIFATRAFESKTYVSNAFFDFVPSGGRV